MNNIEISCVKAMIFCVNDTETENFGLPQRPYRLIMIGNVSRCQAITPWSIHGGVKMHQFGGKRIRPVIRLSVTTQMEDGARI